MYMLLGGLVSKREEELQHNLHIANNGYTYEPNLAIFPLYPLLVKWLANVFNWFTKDLASGSFVLDETPTGLEASPPLILVASTLLNILIFALAADRLYLLSRKVLR